MTTRTKHRPVRNRQADDAKYVVNEDGRYTNVEVGISSIRAATVTLRSTDGKSSVVITSEPQPSGMADFTMVNNESWIKDLPTANKTVAINNLKYFIEQDRQGIKILKKGIDYLKDLTSTNPPDHQNQREWNEYWAANTHRIKHLEKRIRENERDLKELLADPELQRALQVEKTRTQIKKLQNRLNRLTK